MKKIVSLILVLALYLTSNPGIADDGADVFINTGDVGSIDFSGRTFGGDDPIGDLVELLGGRVRKVKKTKEKTYITIEIKTKDKN